MTGHYHLFETHIGLCGIAWNGRGVRRFQLPERNRRAAEQRLGRHGAPAAPPPLIASAIRQAEQYFAGAHSDFADVALDLSEIDAFHQAIYRALRQVGWGETVTYGELARRAGSPGDAQAVGQAMGQNPIPLIIPCHRVLAAGGKIGGFSAYGYTDTKERMLALEGVFINNQPRLL